MQHIFEPHGNLIMNISWFSVDFDTQVMLPCVISPTDYGVFCSVGCQVLSTVRIFYG